jgi:PIN domain nuclease of toxin-antitoxin system
VRLLLDTHVALWAVTYDHRLSEKARGLLLDESNEIYVSAASVWEIAIKHALSRGRPSDILIGGREALTRFAQAGFVLLAIAPSHAAEVEALPRLHADPFDRLLLAQAFSEPLNLLTRDAKILAYGGTTIEV